MNIIGQTRGDIRNNQAGDWRYYDSLITVSSREFKDWRHALLVQVHELVEAALCKQRGITDEEVTQFDAMFEDERESGKHSSTAEDGDDPRAPYRKEHFAATNIERILAAELGVDWKDYEDAVNG